MNGRAGQLCAAVGFTWLVAGAPLSADETADQAATAVGAAQAQVAQAVGWALEGVVEPGDIGRVRFAGSEARPLADPDVIAAGMRLTDLAIRGESESSDGQGLRLYGVLTHESPFGFRAVNHFAARYREDRSRYVVEEAHARPAFDEAPQPVFAIVEAERVPASLAAGDYEPHQLAAFLQRNAVDPRRVDEAPRDYQVFAVLRDRLPAGHGFFVAASARAGRKPERPDTGLTVFARGPWHAAALRTTFALGSSRPLHFLAAVVDDRGRARSVGRFASGGLDLLGLGG